MLIGVLTLGIWVFLSSRKDHNDYNADFQEGHIYIFFRETKSKVGEIAKSYNINNTSYSHCGIGGIVDGKLKIFHILHNNSNSINKNTELHISTLDEFYNPKNDKVFSGKILSVKNMQKNDFLNFEDVTTRLSSRKLKFDTHFDSKDDNDFYCSELVIYILKNTDKNLGFHLINKKISNKIDAVFLEKKYLEYYPVDIFLKDKRFTSIKEWKN